jgi:uncharacterized damage-inducible protein DinB
MSEVERIKEQLKYSMEGNAWHGPSVREVLNGVTASEAAAKPIANAHSIWELTLHIAAWIGAGQRRLTGDRAELPDDEDWLKVSDTSDESWERTKQLLEQRYRELQQALSVLDDKRLDEPILAGMRSVYITLQGVIQHNLYHAGQIAILKKSLQG